MAFFFETLTCRNGFPFQLNFGVNMGELNYPSYSYVKKKHTHRNRNFTPQKIEKLETLEKMEERLAKNHPGFTETASFWGLRPSQQAGKAGAQRSKLRL